MLVHSMFSSINGECSIQHQGSLCLFIRLARCNLRCSWCDTRRAQEKVGKEMSVKSIMRRIKTHGYRNIVITGGEPLLQLTDLYFLTDTLQAQGYNISVETNGSLPIPLIEGVSWVADWKCKSSGMSSKMNVRNYRELTSKDFVKFVIADKDDFTEALSVVKKLTVQLNCPSRFAFSPINKPQLAEKLITWMKGEKLLRSSGAIFSLQIHKLVYPNAAIEI